MIIKIKKIKVNTKFQNLIIKIKYARMVFINKILTFYKYLHHLRKTIYIYMHLKKTLIMNNKALKSSNIYLQSKETLIQIYIITKEIPGLMITNPI
jgi:hypothetical protein